MPRRRTDYRGLLEQNRVRLLGQVQAEPGQTLHEISRATDIPVNTARDHLWALEDEGLITSEKIVTGRRGRPPLAYYAVDDPAVSPSVQRRLEEIEQRRDRFEGIVGVRDGLEAEVVEQLDVLYEHLEDTGLSPTVVMPELEIEVSPGEHRGVYEEMSDAARKVHARLMRDTLALADGPLELREVQPLVGPDSCRVILYLKEVAPEGVDVADCSQRIPRSRTPAPSHGAVSAGDSDEPGGAGDVGDQVRTRR